MEFISAVDEKTAFFVNLTLKSEDTLFPVVSVYLCTHCCCHFLRLSRRDAGIYYSPLNIQINSNPNRGLGTQASSPAHRPPVWTQLGMCRHHGWTTKYPSHLIDARCLCCHQTTKRQSAVSSAVLNSSLLQTTTHLIIIVYLRPGPDPSYTSNIGKH